ncbi:MAG: hypothetical protein GXC94_08105 [Comamonadaceae bacterium]|nr:hypothetical protein [Comamonadaceae bacterium]
MTTDPLPLLLDFLTGIGLDVREGEVPADSFLPGLRLVAGTLVVDRAALRWPGDLLHEAGHVATTPAALRATLDDRLADDPTVAHRGEAEASAWAWAALTRLGLPAELLFHAGGYHGHAAGLALTYAMGVYPGAAGLASAGMTRLGGADGYPRMLRWLRD